VRLPIRLPDFDEIHIDPVTGACAYERPGRVRLTGGDHDLFGALRDRSIDPLDPRERY
jgi:hypothetical protein